MTNNIDKRINYCLIGDDGQPHTIFVIKWEKGNLYFINTGFDAKISYHTPRKDKSQVHIKIKGIQPNENPDFCCPIEKIKGVRPVGGSGIELRKINNLPTPSPKYRKIEVDTRHFHISRLSKIQWYWYLVEPGKIKELEKTVKPYKQSDFTEFLKVHLLDDTVPWVATEFIRIKDENPIWYK